MLVFFKKGSTSLNSLNSLNSLLKPSPKGKIGGGLGNFVRFAVAESGAYLAYVSIYDASKVQNLPIETIYRAKSNKFTNNKKRKVLWLLSFMFALIAAMLFRRW